MRRRWSFALIVVVIGVAAGLTVAAAAGARRSDAAYGRFLDWSHDPELTFSGCECTADQLYEEFDRIRAQPFVAESARFGFAGVVVELPDGARPSFLALSPAVDLDRRLGNELPRVKLLHGRLADPARIDEVTVGFLAAERFGLEVGDELRLRVANAHGPDIATVRIVGVHVAPGELPSVSGPGGSTLLLTPSFAQAFPELVDPANDGLLVRLRPDADPAAVGAFIETLRYHVDVDRRAAATAGIERTIGIETGALVLLSVVVGFVGLVVVGQMIRRHVDLAEIESLTWSALGWGREDTLELAIVRGVAFGIASTALAIAVAIVLSPRFPVGIGRLADPDVGWHVDSHALLVGGAATMLAVIAVTLLVSTRRPPHRRVTNSTPIWPATNAFAVSSSPPVIVGLSFSGPTARRPRSHSRTSLVSVILGVTALTATTVAMASVDDLGDRRELAGATWDAAVLIANPGGDFEQHTEQEVRDYIRHSLDVVDAVPGVSAASPGSWFSGGWNGDELLVDGVAVDAQIFGDDHAIQPAIRAGRAPSSTGEVALGAAAMRAIGVAIGDGVTLSSSAGGPPVPGRVVGEVVLASPYFTTFAPGDGAALQASTFRALGGSELESAAVVLVKYDGDADRLDTFNRVEAALDTDEAFEASDRQGSTGLDRIRVVPVLLISGLLLLVAAALGHVLLLSVSAHRRDLAVLSALGMTNRQISASVVVHGAFAAAAACVIGVPVGVMVGRLVWGEIASYVIVVNRPIAPLTLLGLIVGVLALVALMITYIPARQAQRIRPATVLRAL